MVKDMSHTTDLAQKHGQHTTGRHQKTPLSGDKGVNVWCNQDFLRLNRISLAAFSKVRRFSRPSTTNSRTDHSSVYGT